MLVRKLRKGVIMTRNRGCRVSPEDISKSQAKVFGMCLFSFFFLTSQIINLYRPSFMDDSLMKAGVILWAALAVFCILKRHKDEDYMLSNFLGGIILTIILAVSLTGLVVEADKFKSLAKAFNLVGWLTVFTGSVIAFCNSWKMKPGKDRRYTVAWLMTPGAKP